MVPVVTISPSTGSAIMLTDGCDFNATGKYLYGAPKLGRKEYERVLIPVPGVSGTDTKNFGYRKQRLEFSAFYVSTNAAAVVSAFEADNAAVNAYLSTILYGHTWIHCQCVRFEMVRGIRPALSTGAYAEVEMAFECLEI